MSFDPVQVAALEGALAEAEARHRAAIAKAIAETAQERTQALELQRRFANLQRTAAQVLQQRMPFMHQRLTASANCY